MQVFTHQEHTPNSGVNQIMVRLVAAGGGGSGHCEFGEPGGFSEKIINVTGLSTVSVVIGTGGTGTYYSEDLDKVPLHHLVHSCQQLEEMVQTRPINTQEDLEELFVEMLICTVVGEVPRKNKWWWRI